MSCPPDSVHCGLRKQKLVLKHLDAASGISALRRPCCSITGVRFCLPCGASPVHRGACGGRGLCRRLPGRRPGSPGPCCPPSCSPSSGRPSSRSQGMDVVRCWSARATVTVHRRGGSHTRSLFSSHLELGIPDKALIGPLPGSSTAASLCAHVVPRTHMPSVSPS